MSGRGLERDIGARRLGMVLVLVVALVLTLIARLYYVQLLDPNRPVQTAGAVHDGAFVVPAPRGSILDATGAPLVDSVATQVLTIDRDTLLRRRDHGAAVIARVAPLIGVTPARLAAEITPCSSTVPAPCWTGEPYQPVPVLTDVTTRVALTVEEHREDYPGIALSTVYEPHYPGGSLAAHVLGYTGQVTADDVARIPSLSAADLIGLSGLEQQYDTALRGTDGSRSMRLDARGLGVGPGRYRPPVPGNTLVTSLDARLQRLAESSLAQQIVDSRAAGKPASSGAVVAMDPQTGRLLAVASYPSYDPALFTGGISDRDYAALQAPAANDPLLSRAIAGQYAPGSTFKLITASSLVDHHEIALDQAYPCPGSLSVDGRVKTNYDSESFGFPLTLASALGFSCDTFFYAPAVAEYYHDEARIARGEQAQQWLQRTAAGYGIGSAPQVDLPADEQAAGSYADRGSRLARWRADRVTYCRDARRGYPGVTPASQRAYLTQLASENCTDGWRYRAGDNADLAIGQGETTLSPLQLAVAYSALVNGGRLWAPTIGRAVVDGSGTVLRTITPRVRHRVPADQQLLDYIANSLSFAHGDAVSGAFAYIGSPYVNRIGGKTGTAEVYGRQDTSWLASWGPVYHRHGHVRARFVLVGMIEQGGTGATAAGPMLKRIWDSLLGANGVRPLLPAERPSNSLPSPHVLAAAAR